MRVGDAFTLVISNCDNNKKDKGNVHRSALLSGFKRVIMVSAPRISTAEKEKYIHDLLAQREVLREGCLVHKFNLRITSYLERNKLEQRVASSVHIDSILHPRMGIGMYMELLGYGSQGICHLKHLSLPYVKVHVQRANTGAFFQQKIDFKKKAKEENLMLNVAKEFYASKEDAAAYVEILIKYYRSCVPAERKTKEIEGDANHDFRMAIACELEATSVTDFANVVDSADGSSWME